MEQLINKLNKKGLIDLEGNIILEIYENGSYQAVNQQIFQNFFGTTDFSYEQLVQTDGEKGYKRFFDKWKEKGIV